MPTEIWKLLESEVGQEAMRYTSAMQAGNHVIVKQSYIAPGIQAVGESMVLVPDTKIVGPDSNGVHSLISIKAKEDS